MALSRGKGKVRASNTTRSRNTRSAAGKAPANVYDELVAEATALEQQHRVEDRPLKRRRVAITDRSERQHQPTASKSTISVTRSPQTRKPPIPRVQTIEASDDDDDESEFDFEDVDLDERPNASSGSMDEAGIQDVSISIQPTTTPKKRSPYRRKPASASEKALRILIHKSHLLCLLGHCMYVNTWCNDDVVHELLKGLLDKKSISNLTLGPQKSQFDRNRWFLQGLEHAVEMFKVAFKVSASGLRRASPVVNGDGAASNVETDPIDRAEFQRAAKAMSGSQDIGNQLFCALLRSVGVRARLVCSLQAQPFAAGSTSSNTPQKSDKPVVFATPPAYGSDRSANTDSEDSSVSTSKRIGKIPSVKRRLGQPAFSSASTTAPSPAIKTQKRSVRKLSYPIFWVEAFNASHQKWIAVDPIVTHTVNKPAKLEPPGSYQANQLTYVVAFEGNGVARDVTRRYAKAFNAKTRRQRVESLENGTEWWMRALSLFRKRGRKQDSDQVEDAELAQKEAQEGMPNNVQDFKHHPYYALERHLKRYEVIHPRQSAGRTNLGTSANPKMEHVFRRQHVLTCRSADKWYRLGRQVKKGELPLKHITTRIRSKEADADDGASKTTAVYAAFQTELYVPPPVVKGKVPRNGFGNLDVYVPSMVPAGGTHIRHELAKQAAQILKVDCADAVTGFSFKGRHGTAIIEGVVVATQYEEAVQAVIEGMETEQEEEAGMKRSMLALQLWQRLLTGLRIRERVSEYGELSKQEADMGPAHELSGGFRTEQDTYTALPTAGRFSLNELKANTTPKKRKSKKEKKPDSDDEEHESEHYSDQSSLRDDNGGGFIGDDQSESGGGFVPSEVGEGGFLPLSDDGGGFLPDAAQTFDGAGGFIADDEQDVDEDMPYETGIEGGGFVADEPVPAVERDKIHASIIAGAKDKDTEGLSTNGNTRPTGRDTQVHGVVDPAAREAAIDTSPPFHTPDLAVRYEEDEGSDHGSLLSHDPEDDDAEPDWLESD